MKKLIAIFLLLGLCAFTNQNMTETKMWLRVDNVEKQNVMMKGLMKALFAAFANGEIKAYYPADLNKEVSYASFLKHFGYPEIEVSDDETTTLECLEDTQIQMDPWFMHSFTRYAEIYETQGFNKTSSRYTHKIHRIHTIFPANNPENLKGIDFYGPVFKWEDIVKIKRKVYNPKNYAMKYTPEDILKLRLFNPAYIKKGNNDYWEKPSIDGEKERKKQLEKEVENWEH